MILAENFMDHKLFLHSLMRWRDWSGDNINFFFILPLFIALKMAVWIFLSFHFSLQNILLLYVLVSAYYNIIILFTYHI